MFNLLNGFNLGGGVIGDVFELFTLFLPWWLYGDDLHLYDSIIVVYSSLFSSVSVSIIIFLSIFYYE